MGTGHSLLTGRDCPSPKIRRPAKLTAKMGDDETFSWVFESLVGFLKGPVWEAAVLTYIEKKSVVFDPVEGNEDEYKKLHNEYKNLVDTMLSSHMEDLGIGPEEFERACSETEKNIHSQFRKSLFEQLWAADDYEIFKRMMTQKNLELQLQALDLLAHQYGLLPESFLPGEDYEPSDEEKNIMETVMKRYVEENSGEMKEIPQSLEQKEVIQATKAHLQEERQREIKRMEKAIDSSLHDTSVRMEYEKPLEITKMTEVSQEEARRRQEYLKQQRDKLLALKKQEREKLLQNYEKSSSDRPRSARAAKRMVEEEQTDADVDPKVLAFRKSLAAKLKAEVVDQK
ncbi:cilia- and flagella-associated protein 36-like isoform X1 [Uloborus diversus]|uniref:cilia- and flagella-associated protein 36-like isoform X1 n=1 Tax=Uloborus diversus TaxID=327109 RepID=UPI00240930C0|nr:cilia- and flagella-associated protein 36-like isoform X1 [Uloborus diversus]